VNREVIVIYSRTLQITFLHVKNENKPRIFITIIKYYYYFTAVGYSADNLVTWQLKDWNNGAR
jgi:hypothetical protein